VQIEGCHGSDTGSCLAGEENNKMTAECCGNHVSDSNGNVMLFSLPILSQGLFIISFCFLLDLQWISLQAIIFFLFYV